MVLGPLSPKRTELVGKALLELRSIQVLEPVVIEII